MKGWKADKGWSDRFLPEIKLICGTHLIGEAPAEEDQERATDLMVLDMKPLRIGCRVRNNYVIGMGWGGQFTIRYDRPMTGATTELEKILDGWGSHFFYGISDEHEMFLERWLLGDLDVFRTWWADAVKIAPLAGGKVYPNKNLDSRLLALDARRMPPEFFIARSTTNRYDHCMDLFAVNEPPA